jgi:hypothetical protein
MQFEQEQVAASSENDQRRKDLSQGMCQRVNEQQSSQSDQTLPLFPEESSLLINLAEEDAPS